jgi:hypothetical protein
MSSAGKCPQVKIETVFECEPWHRAVRGADDSAFQRQSCAKGVLERNQTPVAAWC